MQPRYGYTDPSVGVPLHTQHPGSQRIRSWLSRSVCQTGFPLDREVQIFGAVGIVTGLEYHHRQFMARVQSLEPLTSRLQSDWIAENAAERIPTPDEFSMLAELHHEAVAYLNRVGQLHFFARALDKDGLLAETAALLPFRHKHTAHRSVDAPRSESQDDLQQQTMAFGFAHTLQGGFPVFQIRTNAKWTTFNMKVAHPVVLQEAVALFEAIFPLPSDA